MRLIFGCMQEFTEKINKSIMETDWDSKRKIICVLVKRIEIDENGVKVIYRASLTNLPQDPKPKKSFQYCSRSIVSREDELLHPSHTYGYSLTFNSDATAVTCGALT